MNRFTVTGTLGLVLGGLLSPRGVAQEVLPPPEKSLNHDVGITYKESKPGKVEIPTARPGSPNVIVVLLDDVGFGAAGTFGGPVPTPTLDMLARDGLRFNCFHTTALSSPTRACLLTGRNHHSAATGALTSMANGFDGYTSMIPRSCATIAEILKDNGYGTACFGKWHNAPMWELSPCGPFDHWPTSMGFEKFYGFVGGEMHQFQPTLYEGTTPVNPPAEPGYHLSADLADQAIRWMHAQKSTAPHKPFFVYWAPGATHTPHQAPREWVDRFKGQFDGGWDALREATWRRQISLGVIPPQTRLTPRPEGIPAWDSLSADERRFCARGMEVYAGYLAHVDYQVGRMVDAVREMGQWENTLFIYIVGDNGASGEGPMLGSWDGVAGFNDAEESMSLKLAHIDDLGTASSSAMYSAGWGWACNSPFKWVKEVASHFGGTRNPMVITWPERIADRGGLRSQFTHVIDVAPTILDACGVKEPVSVGGVAQKPMEGVSFIYTFDNAAAPERHTRQYFEMVAHRAIYENGWIASCFHGRAPWMHEGGGFESEKWELYNLSEDFSQADDLVEKYGDKLKYLKELFLAEAGKYNVLPLDERGRERLEEGMFPRDSLGRPPFAFYEGKLYIPEWSVPNIKNRSYTITAEVEVPKEGCQGVIVCEGGFEAGYSLYVREGRPAFEYNFLQQEKTQIASPDVLKEGKAVIEVDFAYDGEGEGRGGEVTLSVNGVKAAQGRLERTIPKLYSAYETFNIGEDAGSPVGEYPPIFPFTGRIDKVSIDPK